MEFRRHMIPVSEFARRKGMDELELIYMIRSGTYGYKGYADEEGYWFVDDRSPLHYRSPASAISFSLICCLLSCLSWASIIAGMLACYLYSDRLDEPGAGLVSLLAGLLSGAVFAVLGKGLELLQRIESNTRSFRLRIEQDGDSSI